MTAPVAPFRLSVPMVRVLLADLGVRSGDLLRAAGLPAGRLGGDEAVLAAHEYYALFDALDELTGDRDLATSIADKLSPEVFDPPIFAAMCSANLGVAADRIARHKRLLGPLQLRIEHDADGMDLEVIWPPGEAPARVLPGIEVAFWVALARLGTRTTVTPQRVVLPQQSADTVSLEAWLGARVEGGDTTLVRFSRLDTARPFLTANAAMWNFFEPDLRRRLDDLDDDTTLAEQVRAALIELLPAGTGSAGGVARHLGVSTRTLQRHLGDEGTTFQTVLADVRESLAHHYLTQSAMPLTEIAFLLGYDDPNSFHRAFHQWTGNTPLGVRHAPTG